MAENLRRNGGKSPCRWQTRADLCISPGTGSAEVNNILLYRLSAKTMQSIAKSEGKVYLIEHRFSDVPGTAIGAVQANLDTLEGIDTKADQVAHIAVAACHIVHSAADVFPVGKGQLRPVLIERMEFSVDVILD